MTLAEALEYLAPAVAGPGGTWLDLGAGTGLFTRALARLVGGGGHVIAMDRDPAAVAALRRLPMDPSAAPVTAILGDFRDPGFGAALDAPPAGTLLANVLHFVPDPVSILRSLAELFDGGGRVIVVEYEGRLANPWVPHPLPVDALRMAARTAGLTDPHVVARRPSRYGGTMYCAVMHPA